MPDPIRNALLTARSVKPTPAQKEAGNYKKHHVKWNGLDIAIENPKGSIRSGQDHNGKRWSVKMPAHYGYIKRTEGADGDHVDVYLGPDLNSQRVFIVNQHDNNTDKFDEHKCLIGFPNFGDARRAYVAGFSDGKGAARIGSIKEMNVNQFKDWLKDEDKTKRIARADGGKIDKQYAIGNLPKDKYDPSLEGIHDDNFLHHATHIDNLPSIKEHGLLPKSKKTFQGFGTDKISLSPTRDAAQYWLGRVNGANAGNSYDGSKTALLRVNKDKAKHHPSHRKDEVHADHLHHSILELFHSGKWNKLNEENPK